MVILNLKLSLTDLSTLFLELGLKIDKILCLSATLKLSIILSEYCGKSLTKYAVDGAVITITL